MAGLLWLWNLLREERSALETSVLNSEADVALSLGPSHQLLPDPLFFEPFYRGSTSQISVRID